MVILQREVIYSLRKKVISRENIAEQLKTMLAETVEFVVYDSCPEEDLPDNWDFDRIEQTMNSLLLEPVSIPRTIEKTNDIIIDVVDALGGIDVEVPYDRLEKDENDKNTIYLKKGLQHLDGKHALALARTRKLDTDVERGKRQQMILQAIMKEAISFKSVTKYGDIIDALGDNMKTNMTFDEMKSFLEYAKGGMPQVDTKSDS